MPWGELFPVLYPKLTSENREKRGSLGTTSPCPLCSALKPLSSSEIRARKCQPHIPGPGRTRCAHYCGAFHAPAAVAEGLGVAPFGAPSRRSGTIHPYGYIVRRFSLRTPLPDSHRSMPVAQAGHSDPRHVPGGGTCGCEDHSSRMRVAAASVSVIANSPIGEYRPTRNKRVPKDCEVNPGKAPRQGISSSRVKADCRSISTHSTKNDGFAVGSLWNSRIAVDCVGKRVLNCGL